MVFSMEEIISMVQFNVDNVKQVNGLVFEVLCVVIDGGKLIEQVVGIMVDINQFVKKIEDIIGVIDGIVFQINILVLNVVVEVVCVGEQGCGFVVVVFEVCILV